MIITLADPGSMNIKDANGEIYIGGSQEWYEDKWHKLSGCGPVAASNLIWYKTRAQGGREQYLELIREMFGFVTPKRQGVNTSAIFTGGLALFGEKNGLRIATRALEIPGKPRRRPGIGAVRDFISTALGADSPVAFLSLSNGSLSKLDNWHWVTIIALDTENMHVEISDDGKTFDADIAQWLKTSLFGGAFVYLASCGA